MRFLCIKCNKETNIYKVKFTSIDNKLVCKYGSGINR